MTFNPLIFSGLVSIPPSGAVTWRGSVSTESNLPLAINNTLGDAIAVRDTGKVYVWAGDPAKWYDTGLTVSDVFGETPNSVGYSIEETVVNIGEDTDVVKESIVLQPADASNPGAISTTSQDIAGTKTFKDDVIVEGSIDAQSGIDSSNGTLTIGANAGTINIGNSGTTVTITGTTLYETVQELLVKDARITLNDGGAAESASESGIEVEEDGVATGYVQVSSDRNTWELKAPNQEGVVVLDGGASGITLDQSSHNPISIDATPNGLSVTGDQVLSIAEANGAQAGVVTENPQTFDGQKTFTDNIVRQAPSSDYTITLESNRITVYNVMGGDEYLSSISDGYIDLSSTVGEDTAELELDTNSGIETVIRGTPTLKLDSVGDITLQSITEVKVTAQTSLESNKIINLQDPTEDQDAATKIYVDSTISDSILAQDAVTKEPTGFVNRDDSTISFSSPNFSITPTGVSFDVYVKGVKFTKESVETIEITSTGHNYIYYDDLGVLTISNVFDAATIIQNNAFVAIVYLDAVSNLVYLADERHGLTMDGATHSYLHTVFGARFISGLALQNFNLTTPSFEVDQGSIRDEDILHTIAGPTTQIPILYREGLGTASDNWKKKAADAYPVIYSGTAGYTGANGRLPYNNFNGTSWVLTELSNSSYVLVHVFATNDVNTPIVGIQGIAEHSNINDARNAANTEISSLSGLPFAEFVPIGSVVFQTADSYNTATKSEIQQIDGLDYIDFRGTQLYTPAGEATTHSLLSGLASDDHIQYLLADGTRTMGGALNMGTHQINNVVDPTLDQDAATKAYVDSKVSDSIIDGITTVSPSQNAVYDALAGKQDTGDYITELSGDVTATGPGAVDATITANAVTNDKLAKMATHTLKGNATISDADPQDLTDEEVRSVLSIIPDAPEDLSLHSYDILDNQSTPTTITVNGTDLSFSNNVHGFHIILSVVRNGTYAEYSLRGVNKSSSWEMSQDYIGDDTGVSFNITSSGDVQYTSTDTGSVGTIYFRAQTV